MYDDLESRILRAAHYIIENGATVRSTAAYLGISKSTVHKDVTSKLKGIDYSLYEQVANVLMINKAERHIRGGMATHRKYCGQSK